VGLILLDSTVIVRLREIVGSDSLAASVISYAELMTGVCLGHHSHERVDRFFDTLVKDLLPVDRTVAARAATLRGKRISLRMPDALILATADLHEDIDTIVCADDDWPKVKRLSCKVELLKPVPKSKAKTSKRPD
jgi:predicted nucleic acid-binding protein